MVQAKGVELVMSRGELQVRIEKRWIARHSLVQQVDYLNEIQSCSLVLAVGEQDCMARA